MSKNTTNNQSIEVAALLGETVVDVKHVTASASNGKTSTAAKVMMAGGALALATSAAAFGMAVQTASNNKAGLETWTRTLHKPAYSFRADHGSAALDATAAAGGALGLLGVTLGLARMRRDRKNNVSYRIGTAPSVELAIENAPTNDYALVEAKGDSYVVNVAAGMNVEMTVDGQSTQLAAGQTTIPANAKIRTKLGKTTIVASSVDKPADQGNPLFALDKRAAGYAAGSLAAHLAAVAFLAMVPAESGSTNIEIGSQDDIAMKSSNTDNEQVQQQMKTEDGDSESGPQGSLVLEGLSGKPELTKTGENKSSGNQTDIEQARAEAREAAREANPWGGVSVQIASVTGDVDLRGGVDDADTTGRGGGDGDGGGDGGFGNSRGDKVGNCPMGVSSCLIKGKPGYDTEPGTKKPKWELTDRTPHPPGPELGKPTIAGNLDKEIIRRHIRRQAEKIGYCYESRLLGNSQLGDGNVMVTFFINPDGSVATSKANGFDAGVGSCVSEVIASISFPKPDGGGGVQVNYPFAFHRVGA